MGEYTEKSWDMCPVEHYSTTKITKSHHGRESLSLEDTVPSQTRKDE